MTEIRARLAPGREVDDTTFADITTTRVTGRGRDDDGSLVVTFADPLTDDQAAAVRRRIMSTTPTEEQLRADAEKWLDALPPRLSSDQQQLRRLTEIILGLGE